MNWNGPSDTGQPKGAPFPPGCYAVSVRAGGRLELEAGPQIFTVEGTLPVEIVP